MLDLLDAEASSHFEVERLSDPEGLSLLRGLGVIGVDAALTEISQTWDGHALTLSLIATYLRDVHGGDAAKIEQIPPPTSGEDRYKRVGRVLRRYDENLSEAERAFLTIFSAFRTPLPEDALQKVFRTPTSETELNRALTALDEATFAALMARLEAARLLRNDPAKAQYTTHPLIRGHYYQRLTGGAEAQAVHANVKGYYYPTSLG